MLRFDIPMGKSSSTVEGLVICSRCSVLVDSEIVRTRSSDSRSTPRSSFPRCLRQQRKCTNLKVASCASSHCNAAFVCSCYWGRFSLLGMTRSCVRQGMHILAKLRTSRRPQYSINIGSTCRRPYFVLSNISANQKTRNLGCQDDPGCVCITVPFASRHKPSTFDIPLTDSRYPGHSVILGECQVVQYSGAGAMVASRLPQRVGHLA